MKTVCLLNASLRGEASSSLAFLDRVAARLSGKDVRIERITLKPGVSGPCTRSMLETAAGTDAVVIAFPLFSYTVPGALTAFFEDFQAYIHGGGARRPGAAVYAVVNCGFPEPWIMREAVGVVKNFCARLGLRYRFSIAISSGPVTVLTMKAPLLNPVLKRAFSRIASDIAEGGVRKPAGDVYVKPVIPKAVILRIKAHYEKNFVTEPEPAPAGGGSGNGTTAGVESVT